MSDKSRMARKWLYAVWGAGAIIFAGYYALWRYAAGEMETAVTEWMTEQRENGLQVEHGAIRRDGFPFFLRVHIDAPHIASEDVGAWRAERLTLDALPYDLNRLIFSPSGEQTVVTEQSGLWRFEAEDLRASIANDESRGWVFAVTMKDASSNGPLGQVAKIDSLIFDIAPDEETPTTLTLALAGAGYAFRDADRSIDVDKVNVALSLTQTHMLSGADAVDNWRHAGGALTIHGMNAAIDQSALSVFGTIGLDNENLPAGELTASLEKPAGLAGALAASGALSAEEADAATAGLAFAAMSQGGRIEAPIILHAGAATIAGVKIADLK